MDLPFKIITAAYARGTHHKLALYALNNLTGTDAERWRRLFLKNAQVYVEGSKAPDDKFKDFKNHVLHPRQNYWGGAPDKTVSWYGKVVEELRAQRWPDAVYAAGIMSHYLVDPVMPFHTDQCEAENNIHRACEWSISKSFDNLRAIGEREFPNALLQFTEGPGWLADLVCRGADKSRAYYEALIAHYDIHRGVSNPPDGLDPVSRRFIAELLMYASVAIGCVLDRAVVEAGVAAPEVDLTADSILAGLKMPIKFVTKKLADAGDRRQVEAMYHELMTTGTVETHLPADDRAVRELHTKEVVVPALAAQAQARTQRVAQLAGEPRTTATEPALKSLPKVAAVKPRALAHTPGAPVAPHPDGELPVARASSKRGPEPLPPPPDFAPKAKTPWPAMGGETPPPPVAAPAAPVAIRKATPVPLAVTSVPAIKPQRHTGIGMGAATMSALAHQGAHFRDGETKAGDEPGPPAPTHTPMPTHTTVKTQRFRAALGVTQPTTPIGDMAQETGPQPASLRERLAEPHAHRERGSQDAEHGSTRHQLRPEDPVVDAPSIGPKTADRLSAAGITTVAHMLLADPDALSTRLDVRHIQPSTVRDWQDEARLVMAVQGLRGTHAQILVGSGFRDVGQIASADPATLQAAVLRFAATHDGERVLRSGEPPDMAKIQAWIAQAAEARNTKAA